MTVVALHESGGVESAVVVGRSRTDSDGEWSVPPLPADTGTRSFEVRTLVDGKPLIYDFVRRPGDPGSEVAGGPGALTLRMGAGRTGGAAKPQSPVDSLVARPSQVEPARDASGPQDAPVMAPGQPARAASASCTYVFVAQDKYKKVWAPLKVSRTRAKSTLKFRWSTTKKTDLGVVLNTPSGSTWAA